MSEAAANDEASGAPERLVESENELNLRLAFFPLTDLGNAERFRERYKERLMWLPSIGGEKTERGWLVWNGKRWSRDGADDYVKIAEHDTVRLIQAEAAAVRASGRRDVPEPKPGACDYLFNEKKEQLYSDRIAAHGRASEAASKLAALSKRGAPYLAVDLAKLDADTMKINVRNGTLIVKREAGEDGYITFKPHDPADLITKLAPVDYDPAAECPTFGAFLAEVQPQQQMRDFLLQWFGLSLTGDTTEQKLVFCYGKGGNGKSVLIDAVSYIAGDYGRTVSIESFLDNGRPRMAGQASPDLAILPAIRMLRASEAEQGSRLAEATIKLMTGGEAITARHLNGPFFQFYPQFKLTISGNYRPKISGTDEGIWRRVRLVPFGVTIPKERRDPHLIDKLRAEASGILNRLLEGLCMWLDKGLLEPAEVMEVTTSYRSDNDPLGRFLETCVATKPGGRVQSSTLHSVFCAWCKANGEKEWSNRGLTFAMRERGYKWLQSTFRWWLDIALTKTVDDFLDADGKPLQQSELQSMDAETDEDIEF